MSELYHDMELPLPPSSGLFSCLLTLELSVLEKGYVNGKRRIVGFNPQKCSSLIIQCVGSIIISLLYSTNTCVLRLFINCSTTLL